MASQIHHRKVESRELAIGEVAVETGVAVSAIRYYDELGIVAPSSRVGGKRRFSPDVIGTVSFVRRAQEAGFTLEEIKRILDDQAGEWADLVAVQLDRLREKRAELDVMIATLEEVRRCGCQVVAACPRFGQAEPPKG